MRATNPRKSQHQPLSLRPRRPGSAGSDGSGAGVALLLPLRYPPPSPSGAGEEHQTTDPKVHVLPEDPPTYVKQRFAQLQAMLDQENEKTSPPDGEHITFRSVTLAELYVGAEIDALAAALQKATWVNTDERFAEEIATARQLDAPYACEFLLRSSPASPSFRESYSETDLPARIARIIGQLNVLGPSLTSLVLTFVLTDEEADYLDGAIRDEADANLRETDSPASIETVYVVKSKRVQAVLDEVGQHCATWLQSWAPGALGVGDGIGVPLCSLISAPRERCARRELSPIRYRRPTCVCWTSRAASMQAGSPGGWPWGDFLPMVLGPISIVLVLSMVVFWRLRRQSVL